MKKYTTHIWVGILAIFTLGIWVGFVSSKPEYIYVCLVRTSDGLYVMDLDTYVCKKPLKLYLKK